ncbi:hypothetical protein ASE21_11900 [Flavobacterium sp. Root901]|nr:hypothetical protein ASE21_11900 [Flavobacterium sp. Root901]
MFSLMAYHTFFDNQKCNCLHFKPNKITENILLKFGFKIDSVSNGFELFGSTQTSLPDLLDYISKTTFQDYFEFEIKCSNPSFNLFTEMPIQWLGQITYSSQDSKNQSANGIISLNQTLETKTISPHFGSVKIYFDDLQKNLYSNTPIQYKINFEARATQWQYYFINRNAVPLNNPSITEKGAIQFEGPQQVTIQTGEEALLFTSSSANIPLSEKPKYKFDLINKSDTSELNQNSSKGKIIFKGLPVPDVSRIGILNTDEKSQVTSPIYIYL